MTVSVSWPSNRVLMRRIYLMAIPNLLMWFCRVAVVIAFCGIFLTGCGKKTAGQPGGQVVAHVGDEVVTTQELENEFRWANVPADKQKDPDTLRKVLGDLVLRKYLLQQALASKLDREPSILLDVLRSREQVLANAFLQRSVASKSPGKADIDRYIANNPSLAEKYCQ